MTASSPPTCVQQKMFSRDPLSDSVDRMTVLNLYMFGSFQQCQILKDVASNFQSRFPKENYEKGMEVEDGIDCDYIFISQGK